MFSYSSFLLAYFFSKKRDRSGLVFSHFKMERKFYWFIINIFFYDASFEEQKSGFLLKVKKYIKSSFDRSFLQNNKKLSNITLIKSLSNSNKRSFWLRDFLKMKKNTNIKTQINFLKVSSIRQKMLNKVYMKFFNSFALIWLTSFFDKDGYIARKKYFSKTKFINNLFNSYIASTKLPIKSKFIEYFCKSMKNHSFLNKLNLPWLKTNFSKVSLVDRWTRFSDVKPKKIMSSMLRRKKLASINGVDSHFKLLSWAFFVAFHSYMSRYYLSTDSITSVWKNFRYWNGLNSHLKKTVDHKVINKNNDFMTSYLNKNPWATNLNNKDFYSIPLKKEVSIRSNSYEKMNNKLNYRNNKSFKKPIKSRNYFQYKNKLFSVWKAVFFLVFISFLSSIRLSTAYDWKYWFYLLKQIQAKNYEGLYKYFKYRSLFTTVSYKTNMVSLSFILGFLFKSAGRLSFKKFNIVISDFIQNLYLSISHLLIFH